MRRRGGGHSGQRVGAYALTLLACVLLSGGCNRSTSNSSDQPPPMANIQGMPPAGDGQPKSGRSGPGTSSNSVLSTDATKVSRPESPASPIYVTVTTNLGNFKIRLRPDKAPRTVENFLENYVDRGFYDNTIFHHVERDFMIVAGGYTADLQAKPTRAWIRNESNNGLSNRRGTVAMARHPDYPHSATSQFFINMVDNPSLDYRPPPDGQLASDEAYGYAVFGEVAEGMDVVDRIAAVPTRAQGEFPAMPTEPVIIQSIRRSE